MVLNDMQIQALCEGGETPMITPFESQQIRTHCLLGNEGLPAISFGLSSFGYDIQLSADGIRLFRSGWTSQIIDPKSFADDKCTTYQYGLYDIDDGGLYYLLPPRAYALGVSVETFDIPVNILGICYCKSTYARCGLMVNTTPLEPGWRGQLVIELANLTDLPMKIYANEGIAQVVFFTGDVPSTTYADRSGKYQDQRGIVTARV